MRHSKSIVARTLTNAWIPLLCAALLFAMPSAANAASTTYVMTESGDFGTLNLSTGSFIKLGNSGLTPAGMRELGSNLYIESAATLYQVNLSNGG
jgi:hypothetical protein